MANGTCNVCKTEVLRSEGFATDGLIMGSTDRSSVETYYGEGHCLIVRPIRVFHFRCVEKLVTDAVRKKETNAEDERLGRLITEINR